MTDASGTTNYTLYDNRNRLKTKATPEGTLNYTYDPHSNLSTILSSNTNGASITYTPDPLNRVGTVVDNRLVAQGVRDYDLHLLPGGNRAKLHVLDKHGGDRLHV